MLIPGRAGGMTWDGGGRRGDGHGHISTSLKPPFYFSVTVLHLHAFVQNTTRTYFESKNFRKQYLGDLGAKKGRRDPGALGLRPVLHICAFSPEEVTVTARTAASATRWVIPEHWLWSLTYWGCVRRWARPHIRSIASKTLESRR